ncbi:hypothetical protein [Actinospica sp.]|jgi:hypothetical protein|uniref:hypothetical protein n=1 Tax=Actinospica sp. TaxID=1872142 RepID=UPI002D1B7FAE|nr:hypothetical protein [Actinospica sp.]HWG28222.1 hypothetical protein [Actinospica sp.]
MDGMESMLEVSVGIPRQLWDRVELAAQDESVTAAAIVAEALEQHLSCRARLRSVEAWARRHASGADYEELVEVDPNFDVAGCC